MKTIKIGILYLVETKHTLKKYFFSQQSVDNQYTLGFNDYSKNNDSTLTKK